jgi:glycosyltransferase involved in cell wall biosynthesis
MAMKRLLEDDDHRLQLRRQGLTRAAEFTWERAARETLAVFQEALVA